MIFKIPIPQKISTNEGIRQHWRKRKAQVDLYTSYFIEFRKKKPIEKYPIEITYIFSFKGKTLDTTNCTFMAKLIEDALIANGLLEDDDIKYVEGTHIYSQKGKKDEVEVQLAQV